MRYLAAITTQRRWPAGAGLLLAGPLLAGPLLALWPACGGGPPEPGTAAPGQRPEQAGTTATASDEDPTCPTTAPAPALLPGTEAAHLGAAYWLERVGATHDLDEVLLAPDDIRRLDASMRVPRERFFPQRDLLAPFDAADMQAKLAERMAWLGDKFAAGEYVTRTGAAPPALATVAPGFRPELRVALDQVPFHCAPTTEGLFSSPEDLRIDRNRCSTARAQEVIEVLAPWPGGMQLARTRYTWGWIPGDAALSPPPSAAHAERFVRGPFVTAARPEAREGHDRTDELAAYLPATGLVPLAGDRDAVLLATAGGVIETRAPEGWLRPAPRPLTRRAVIEEAFRYVGMPYGFGGKDGGRDCSRLLLDIFETFGIHLPRHSSWQARAGSYSIDVSGVDESERLLLIDAAADKGIVLLHLPGHIMLYLGRNDEDRPMALHAFAEYKAPCPDQGGETLFHVDRVQVTDLELGRDTSKTALIERIDRIAVLGKPPGMELAGAAEVRPAAPMPTPTTRECRRAGSTRVFVSPAQPDSTRPLRVVVTAAEDPGAATLALVDPTGAQHRPPVVRLGGPPHGFVATIPAPARGRWMAVLGDGDDIRACERVYVRSRPRKPDAGDRAAAAGAPVADPVWPLRRSWTPAMEDLFAIFVERLFDYPIDEDLTWSGLHELLHDSRRNILHDHLGLGEDEPLVMIPDCADLPYTLRAYFAWKLGLPFGYHDCPRARPGKPPRCEREGDNLMSRSGLGSRSLSERKGQKLHPDVRAFARFIDREVRREVHSSSGRTHPAADTTDFYPVPLTREALRPGTLFTDPYGHLLVIADWIPQGAGRYGVLVGADAQPDGTVGRRRFWRGSFLFHPDTSSGGAGFKAFRPWVLDESSGQLVALENKELRGRVAPYSTDQYEGSTDDFYEAMDALINPRPLDPRAVMVSLVDALEETVSRRVTSVQNGEDFMRGRGFATIDMPQGAGIFLTTGPWEDYATPSRDLRLLISIDTVVVFPEMVARAPLRFGVRGDRAAVDAAVDALRARLDEELGARTFQYTRSDGSEQALTLAELVRRQERLEMAYNPNDCMERRWAAAPDSPEMETCTRQAPAEQRARMERYRNWFQTRTRPPN